MADNETQTAQPGQADEAGNAVVSAVRATDQASDQQTASAGTAPTLLADPDASELEPAAEPAPTGAPTDTKPRGSIVNQQ